MKKALLFIFASLLIISCEKEPVITFNGSSSVEVGAASSSSQVKFTTNKTWTAASSESWLKVSPASGEAGDITLSLSADANTTYGERSATVTITAGELTQTVTVSQSQNDGLIVSKTSYEIGRAGGSIEVPVQANIDYAVAVDAAAKDWITVTKTKALSSYTIALSVAENTTYDARTGKVVITGGNLKSEITITQSQKDAVLVETTEYEVSAQGGSVAVPLKANVDYTVGTPSADWISVVKIKGLSDYAVELSIAANKTYKERTGTVAIEGAGETVTVNVKQAARVPVKLYESVGKCYTDEDWESDYQHVYILDGTFGVEAYEDFVIVKGFDGVEGYDLKVIFDEEENVTDVTIVNNGKEKDVTAGWVSSGNANWYAYKDGYSYAGSYPDSESGYVLISAYIGDDYVYYYLAWGEDESTDDDHYTAVGISTNNEEYDDYGYTARITEGDLIVDAYKDYVIVKDFDGVAGYDLKVCFDDEETVTAIYFIHDGIETDATAGWTSSGKAEWYAYTDGYSYAFNDPETKSGYVFIIAFIDSTIYYQVEWGEE